MTLAGGALREGLIYGLLGNNHDCDARDRTADSLISRYQLDKGARRAGPRHCHRGVHPVAAGLAPLQALRPPDPALRGPAARNWSVHRVQEGAAARRLHHRQHRHAGLHPAQKKLLSALLFNQRDEFKLEPLEKQGAVTGRQAIRLARILRISLILCMRRTQGTVPRFMLQADEDALTLTLPKGGWTSTTCAPASCASRWNASRRWAGPPGCWKPEAHPHGRLPTRQL